MFAATVSTDGNEWLPTNSVSIAMTDPVYAGLAVTSHRSGVLCQATFAHLTVTGATVKSSARGDTNAPPTTTAIDPNPMLNLAAAAIPDFPAAKFDAKIVKPTPQ